MLEKVDLKKDLENGKCKKLLEERQARLAELQRECRAAGIPVTVVFEGMGAAGKGTQINRLIEPLDPRGFKVYATNRETEEERLHPFLWRFWTKLPEQGAFAIFDRSWYRIVLTDRFDGITESAKLPQAYQDINFFEKQLVDDGAVILKFFLHISKKEQKKRYDMLRASEETAWRVTREDMERNRRYGEYLQMNEEMLQNTDSEAAPWTIVEATHRDYASLKILSATVSRLEEALEARRASQEAPRRTGEAGGSFPNGVLSGADLSLDLSPQVYKRELKRLQERLGLLHSEIYRRRIPVVLVFEGWDAGGKGGAIKRLTRSLDPRGYAVHPYSAPAGAEKVHHYLWRFWVNMPKAGHIAIFDRSWYGRVMVERIEGFCTTEEWRRAYQEINEMEEHLANAGTVVRKFWLHIDKDEQKRRFEERMSNPRKQWKITDEDWRNREKWDQYELAVDEMLVRTSTTYAPWIVVEGNSKRYARVKVLQTVVDALEEKIKERK